MIPKEIPGYCSFYLNGILCWVNAHIQDLTNSYMEDGLYFFYTKLASDIYSFAVIQFILFCWCLFEYNCTPSSSPVHLKPQIGNGFKWFPRLVSCWNIVCPKWCDKPLSTPAAGAAAVLWWHTCPFLGFFWYSPW